MEIVNTEPMEVVCEHCRTNLKTNNLDDFRESGHTYPPTIYFICPECKSESRVRLNIPNRLLAHMVMKISKEYGFRSDINFSRGQKVTAD